MTSTSRCVAALSAVVAAAWAASAAAQYPPPNWTLAPTGKAWQAQYPYAGQCASTGAGAAAYGLKRCTLATAPSFACDASGFPNQSAGYGTCGAVVGPPGVPLALVTGDTQRANKYQHELLNPLDYTPDTTRYPGADYYEIAVHEAWGFQGIASAGTALGLAGLFPDPTIAPYRGGAVPNGQQWTGITAPGTTRPLYTPIWGVGQVNQGGGPVTTTLQQYGLFPTSFSPPFPAWSQNRYVATWPSISIRGQYGRPVVVKWINEFPNNHLFCPHPEAADWPCAIDRTFMGVKAEIDPQKAPPTFQYAPLPWDGVNQYGSPMQPDNSWVTHLHGGEIPPQTDGFAEKWFGNAVTGKLYSPQPWPLDPVFHAPQGALASSTSTGAAGTQYGNVFRPGGPATSNVGGWSSYNSDTYAYPMVNREATIWFHDHTLGKTHHNVIAGPAGFFPVLEPAKHGTCKSFDSNGACKSCTPPAGHPGGSCEYSWIDALTNPRGALNIPKYDLFLAIQDRDFNADGTINFPNGMANVLGASGYPAVGGSTPVVPGPNPQVHPVWVPEYFASNALVNGVIWPRKSVEAGFYRVRVVDGSDARCYSMSFNTTDPWSSGALVRPRPASDLTFTVIANEQGYLPAPVPTKSLTLCPGERYEFVLDLRGLAGQKVFMLNDAAAPFPGGGNGPFDPGSPYPDLATIMRFDVGPATSSTVTSLVIPKVLDPDFVDVTGLPRCASQAPADTVGKSCIAAVRNLYLAEKIDGTTGASLGLQINGVPFEYDVTETPVKGTYEQWNVVNLTVDAHPMHPHLGKFQIVRRQDVDVAGYKLALCQSGTAPLAPYPGVGPTWPDDFSGADNNCTPSMAAGGVQQLTPDPSTFLLGKPARPPAVEAGWKDAMRAMPGQVLTFVGKWDGSWSAAASPSQVTAPGAGNTTGSVGPYAASWLFPDVTSGPYVWHCHINSHEDSEMMRTSLVVKP